MGKIDADLKCIYFFIAFYMHDRYEKFSETYTRRSGFLLQKGFAK